MKPSSLLIIPGPLLSALMILTQILVLPAKSQIETQTDARQQQLATETARTQSLGAFKNVLREDGGVLAARQKWADFQVGLLQDFQYDSNANFDGNGGDDSFSYSPTVFAGANARINNEWSVSGMSTWSSTWYDGVDGQDYWGATGSLLAHYRPRANWPEFFTGAEVDRYEAWNDSTEISKSISAVAGLRNNVQLGSSTGLFYQFRYAHRWSDPTLFNRDQLTVSLGLSQRLAKGLYLQPTYSFGYFAYENDFGPANDVEREDLRHEFALSLVYRLTTYLSLRLSGSFVDNDSTLGTASYQNFSTGLNSGLVYNF
ncbi:MAG: hypothetical protein SFU85_09680 [Candidatus Methylacidiphilales bacterium]|nr:hypothetical protein [Candidatus Methylacidiphilales bacterium]